MDGLEATKEIRRYEKANQINPATIFALTGLASSSVQQEAFATGIDLFLTKPVSLKELKRILEQLPEQSQSS
jgi:CheY-like chemotaxis protein